MAGAGLRQIEQMLTYRCFDYVSTQKAAPVAMVLRRLLNRQIRQCLTPGKVIFWRGSNKGGRAMSYKIRTRDEHFLNDGTPKRILALDGGGLRGILTLSYLAEIESVLRERHGGSKDFRLHHYFDLIAGTSTGSIIAAALARGMAVADIIKKYNDLGQRVFQKSWLRQGYVRAFYDETELIKELKDVYGADTTMGDPSLQTGLLVITKRLDSGSAWPISNNPRGRYFGVRPNQSVVPNSEYPLVASGARFHGGAALFRSGKNRDRPGQRRTEIRARRVRRRRRQSFQQSRAAGRHVCDFRWLPYRLVNGRRQADAGFNRHRQSRPENYAG